MSIAFVILSVIYIGFIVWLHHHWRSIMNNVLSDQPEHLSSICVVIVARNEEKNIGQLLDCLFAQQYPHKQLEIIIFNDQSEDQTVEIIQQKSIDAPFQIRLIDLESKRIAYKKAAITQAVGLTDSELILTTDADCTMSKTWALSMSKCLTSNNYNLVSGPVTFKDEISVFERWQTIEFSSLVATGAATIHAGWPTMCNGANLMYKKSAFEAVHGYQGVDNLASGDDEFLMHKIASLDSSKIGFVKAKEAIVNTQAAFGFQQFWNQRRRWSAKWKHYQAFYLPPMAIFIFLYHLSVLMAWGVLMMNPEFWPILMSLLGSKMLVEWLLLKDVLQFLGKRLSVRGFVLSALFYSFYAVIFGIASNFGAYSWKGRKINNGKYE